MCRAPKAALSSSGALRAQGTHSALPMLGEEVLMAASLAVVEVSSSSQTHVGKRYCSKLLCRRAVLGSHYTSCTIAYLSSWALSEKMSKLSSCGAGAATCRSPASCNAHTQTPRDYCRSF